MTRERLSFLNQVKKTTETVLRISIKGTSVPYKSNENSDFHYLICFWSCICIKPRYTLFRMSWQDTWIRSSVVYSVFSAKEMLSNLLHQLNDWRQIINTT